MKSVIYSPSEMDSIALERSSLHYPLLLTPVQVCRFQASNWRSYDTAEPREGASFLGDCGTKMITLLPALIKAWLNESRFLRCSVAEILWVNHRKNPCVLPTSQTALAVIVSDVLFLQPAPSSTSPSGSASPFVSKSLCFEHQFPQRIYSHLISDLHS